VSNILYILDSRDNKASTRYAGGLYLNSKNGTQWFLLFGSIVSGMTAGLMYSVEGPIITCEISMLLSIEDLVEYHNAQHILNPIAGDAC